MSEPAPGLPGPELPATWDNQSLLFWPFSWLWQTLLFTQRKVLIHILAERITSLFIGRDPFNFSAGGRYELSWAVGWKRKPSGGLWEIFFFLNKRKYVSRKVPPSALWKQCIRSCYLTLQGSFHQRGRVDCGGSTVEWLSWPPNHPQLWVSVKVT